MKVLRTTRIHNATLTTPLQVAGTILPNNFVAAVARTGEDTDGTYYQIGVKTMRPHELRDIIIRMINILAEQQQECPLMTAVDIAGVIMDE